MTVATLTHLKLWFIFDSSLMSDELHNERVVVANELVAITNHGSRLIMLWSFNEWLLYCPYLFG